MSDPPVLNSPVSGWRRLLLRWGRWRALMAITAFSVLASLVLTTALFAALGLVAHLGLALLIGALVPAVVAPLAAHAVVKLAFELEQARAALHHLATRDSLTQAFNRRYLLERLELEVGRAVRTGQPLAVLMIDADEFKSINDRFGHATGDRVLRRLAEVCGQTLRPYDVLARLGGEEFAVLLPDTALQQACDVAGRVLTAASQLQLDSVAGEPLTVSVSVGVGVLASADRGGAALLERADAALYQAKRNGRNQWAC
jgi:diguanylate cyclase (GGDEF)-like protein